MCKTAAADISETTTGIRNVAVIGAGVSGILTGLRLQQQGIAFTIFERGSTHGGLWRYTDNTETGRLYNSLRSNAPTYAMSIADHPLPTDWCQCATHRMYSEYLDDIVTKNKLDEAMRFGVEVLSLDKNSEGDWTVTTREVPAGAPTTARFDAVVVCVGQASEPFLPPKVVATKAAFGGKLIHSAQYRRPDPFVGQRVLIVGIGASSSTDIAHDLVTQGNARQVYMSVRRMRLMLPRSHLGVHLDELFKNWMEYVPIFKLLTFKATLWLLYARVWLSCGRATANAMSFHDRIGEDSGDIYKRIAVGEVKVVPEIEALTPTGARFVDGSEVECDSVIVCTGYTRKFHFDLNGAALRPSALRVFEYVFDAEDPTLAFVLLPHPGGPHTPVADAQTRWIADVFAGKSQLPPKAQRVAEAVGVGDYQSPADINPFGYRDKIAETYLGAAKPSLGAVLRALFNAPRATLDWLFTPHAYPLFHPRQQIRAV